MFVTFLKLFFKFLLAIIKQTTSIFSTLQFRKIPTDAPETASSFPGTCFLHLPPFERFLCAFASAMCRFGVLTFACVVRRCLAAMCGRVVLQLPPGPGLIFCYCVPSSRSAVAPVCLFNCFFFLTFWASDFSKKMKLFLKLFWNFDFSKK